MAENAPATPPGSTGPVLAVLEDGAAGATLIECSALLARALGRDLALVQVQSTLALQAAALPQMQVLAHAGVPWAPLGAQDVERAWRAQTARLQALARGIASRHALHWSLRTVRGEIGTVARSLFGETDLLLFLGAATWRERKAPSRAPAVLAVLVDSSAAAQRGAQLVARLAALAPGAWRVREVPLPDAAALDALLLQPPSVGALAMPRALASAQRWVRLARLGCPVLLIG